MIFIDQKDLQQTEPVKGFKARFVHTDNITLAYWEITAGSVLPLHNHVHEQVATVTKGEFELTVNGITQIMKPGMTAVIPSNAYHSGKAITNCEITDVFFPARDDYR
jgi:quercetin dioxygenase-like cupin family protein